MTLRTSRPRLTTSDGRTARPRAKTADAELLTPQHRQWRRLVCARAQWQCEWIEDGVRCHATANGGYVMIADHIKERADGGSLLDPANGQCLCVSHNTLKANQSRRARAHKN